jgi:acetolactate synthase-1/2/3 large subunit
VGNPDAPVISLCGDGGFMYAVGDLATAAQYGINLVTLVFNNGKFGASQDDQAHGRFSGRIVGTGLRNPDFVALAESFGAVGLRVERLADLPGTVMQAVAADRPAVVDVCGDAMAKLDIGFR